MSMPLPGGSWGFGCTSAGDSDDFMSTLGFFFWGGEVIDSLISFPFVWGMGWDFWLLGR